MASYIRRRKFLATLLGGAAAWPLAARAQQPAMPVIGWLNPTSPDLYANLLRAFHRGLGQTGHIEGRNVAIEYRWAEDQYDRLPEFAADLVARRVAVIAATGGTPPALTAKALMTTIPIVFQVAVDPVKVGLVASLARPGGNVTGVTSLNLQVGPKRLELLHELVPTATVIAALINPTNALSETLLRELQTAARILGLELHVMHASAERDFDAVFRSLIQFRAGALVIGPDAFFFSQSKQLAALAARHAMPTISQYREFVAAGGLASYGTSLAEMHRLAGVYTGRILNGDKPADLPVQQSVKVELVINLKTAKALGLNVPPTLLAIADEVIE
jgi:putative ABC transport system substrate-binding protein